jgi:hypothetical protein
MDQRVHDVLDTLDARVDALRAWANTDGRGATPAPDIAALVNAVVVGVRSANGTQRAMVPLWDQYGDGVHGR